MKPVPRDPLALQARVFAALCADVSAGRRPGQGQTEALRQLVKTERARA